MVDDARFQEYPSQSLTVRYIVDLGCSPSHSTDNDDPVGHDTPMLAAVRGWKDPMRDRVQEGVEQCQDNPWL